MSSTSNVQHRLDRIYSALGVIRSKAESPRFPAVNGHVSFDYATRRDVPESQLENEIQSLIAAIASLKDHLKHWCEKNNKPFRGDALIDSSRDVAIIHDLWNLDKHASLSRSRSGLSPSISDIRSGWFAKSTEDQPASLSLNFRVENGAPSLGVSLSGNSFAGADANIITSDSKAIGRFQDVAVRAIGAWEGLLRETGVPIPSETAPAGGTF